MPGERTADSTPPSKKGSSDDDISLREHMQRQLDVIRATAADEVGHAIVFFNRRLDDLETHLNERYERQCAEKDKAWFDHREATKTAFDAAQEATKTAFDAANRSISTTMLTTQQAIDKVEHALEERFNAQARALDKAEAAADKRFESVNEFRAQLSDQARSFMPRTEAEVRWTALHDRMEQNAQRIQALQLQLTSRLDLSQGAATGGDKAIMDKRTANGAVLALVGMGITVVLAVLAVVTFVIGTSGP